MNEGHQERSSKETGSGDSGWPLSLEYTESPEEQRAVIDKVARMFSRAQQQRAELDQAAVVPVDVTSLRLELEDHDDDEGSDFAFCQDYRFSASVPGISGRPLTLVSVHVQVIDREKIRPKDAFYYEMDGVSHGLVNFATAVFDRCGQIKDNVVRSGSRVWGEELNEWRELAHIEEVVVNKNYRRQGIGSWALRAVLERKELARCPWIFTWPAVLNDNLRGPPDTAELWNAKKAGVISLYRKLGFRRVGDTFIFGYARDETHASRHLPVEEDGEEKPQSGTSSEQMFGELVLDEREFDKRAQQAAAFDRQVFNQHAFDEQFDERQGSD